MGRMKRKRKRKRGWKGMVGGEEVRDGMAEKRRLDWRGWGYSF